MNVYFVLARSKCPRFLEETRPQRKLYWWREPCFKISSFVKSTFGTLFQLFETWNVFCSVSASSDSKTKSIRDRSKIPKKMSMFLTIVPYRNTKFLPKSSNSKFTKDANVQLIKDSQTQYLNKSFHLPFSTDLKKFQGSPNVSMALIQKLSLDLRDRSGMQTRKVQLTG